MAKPRKITVVRYHDAEGRECRKGTPGAVKTAEPSADYYGAVPRPGGGRPRMARLCSDFARSKAMLTRLRADAQEKRYGIVDPFAEQQARPVADHVADYESHLLHAEDTPAHARKTAARIMTVVSGVKARTLSDLDAGAAAAFLADLRAGAEARELPDGVESFRPSEAAALLGVTPTALSKAVRLHGLAASGNGKARRLPRATVQALLDRAARGISAETRNHYARALRALGRWLVESKRIGADPFSGLKLVKTTTDRRHDRRDITRDEVVRLCDAALASPKTFRGLDGSARQALYLTAVLTGLRAGALAGLTPEHFLLGDDRPRIEIPARLAKSRKRETKYVGKNVAADLAVFLAGKPKGKPIWPGSWSKSGAAMLRIDLAAAGIPYAIDGPDGPLFADFHGLRHSHATLSRQAGNDLETTRRSMGHATQAMSARYTHVHSGEMAEAAERVGGFISGGRAG